MSGPNAPLLTAEDSVYNVRVGFGNTLSLGGYELHVSGNVDAPGAITGGTIRIHAQGGVISGNLPSLRINAPVSVQMPVRTTGAVNIADGSLRVHDKPLTIQLP